MKILVITKDHVTDHMGGTRVYAHELNKYLVRIGHEVFHFCYGATVNSELYIDNVKILKMKSIPSWKPLYYIKRLAHVREKIRNIYKEYCPDIIIYHSSAEVQYFLYNHINKNKLFYFVHAMNSHELLFDFFKGVRRLTVFSKILAIVKLSFFFSAVYTLEKISLLACYKIITVSQYDKNEVERFHGSRFLHKISIVPIGIDLAEYNVCNKKNLMREKFLLPDSRFIFIVFRRLEHRMGLENLIKAFYGLACKENCMLLIGGKGSLMEYYSEIIKDLNIENNVKLLGFVSDQDKINYLQASDVFVLPTEDLEGFGIVILEAMACNLPVIATPVGAIPEVIGGLDSNLLAKSPSVDDIRYKLKWVYTNRNSIVNTDRYRRYVENNYDWNKIILKIDELIGSA